MRTEDKKTSAVLCIQGNWITLLTGKIYYGRFNDLSFHVIKDENWESQSYLKNMFQLIAENISDTKESKTKEFFNLERINTVDYFYHITSAKNIKSILQHWLCSKKFLEKNNIIIPMPWGNTLSNSLDKIKGTENYVKLSFNSKNPMFWTKANIERINDQIIIYIKKEVIFLPWTKISDRNSTDSKALIFNYEDIGYNITKYININTAVGWLWKTEEEKKEIQAEILIYEKIPINYLVKIKNKAWKVFYLDNK